MAENVRSQAEKRLDSDGPPAGELGAGDADAQASHYNQAETLASSVLKKDLGGDPGFAAAGDEGASDGAGSGKVLLKNVSTFGTSTGDEAAPGSTADVTLKRGVTHDAPSDEPSSTLGTPEGVEGALPPEEGRTGPISDVLYSAAGNSADGDIDDDEPSTLVSLGEGSTAERHIASADPDDTLEFPGFDPDADLEEPEV